VLFTVPFYILLICNGFVPLVWNGGVGTASALRTRLLRGTGIALAALALAVFAIPALRFLDPGGHAEITYWPDFRGVTSYLSERAGSGDLILFVDDPALGYTVSDFYWHGKPPAPTYDTRDPLLARHKPEVDGDIYWVMSSLDKEVVSRLSGPDQGWADVAPFEHVVVMREARPVGSWVMGLERIVGKMEAIKQDYEPATTLRGCLAQANGDYHLAADIYDSAEAYFILDTIYMDTAKGFEAYGDTDAAWREAVIAKFMRPGNPQVHAWMARRLEEQGYTAESSTEDEIGRLLQAQARQP
jgi:hypothetical protein